MLLAILAFGVSGMAQAQQPNQAQANAIRQNCRSDYQSHCASVPTGTQASLQCLQQHQDELSPPCKTAVAATEDVNTQRQAATATQSKPPATPSRQERAVMRHACGVDFRTWCQGVPLGGGRALACLARNHAHLSPGCKTALAEIREAR